MLRTGSKGPVWLFDNVEVDKEEVVEEEEEKGFFPLGRVNGAVMFALARVLFMVIVLWSDVEFMGGVEMTMPWCGLNTICVCVLSC